MYLILECIIACGIFSLIVLPSLYKNPLKHIMSYPKKIRIRVENLPQYKDTIANIEKRHISIKIISVLVFAIVLAAVAYYSGAKTFSSAFIYVFILFFVVNIFDLLILDIWLFCHSKKTRIPGTEDMDKEYRNPWHHIKGAGLGIMIGTIVSLLSGSIVHIFSLLPLSIMSK